MEQGDGESPGEGEPAEQRTEQLRKTLRAEYKLIQNTLKAKSDDLVLGDPHGFGELVERLEGLREDVKKPREQVADVETLFQISSVLLASAKTLERSDGSILPRDFTNSLLRKFGTPRAAIDWKALGWEAARIFSEAPGIQTMIGPLDIQPKLRKVGTRAKRRPENIGETSHPQELVDGDDAESRGEIDKNMQEMFKILRSKKAVKLEALVLNRKSFAQTVENIFALSFLVKDGRAEIKVADDRSHLVVPRNGPTAAERAAGVSYAQFVFRFDHIDWEFMQLQVPEGGELMQHRELSTNRLENNKPEPTMTQTKLSKKRARREVDAVSSKAESCSKDPNSAENSHGVDATQQFHENDIVSFRADLSTGQAKKKACTNYEGAQGLDVTIQTRRRVLRSAAASEESCELTENILGKTKSRL